MYAEIRRVELSVWKRLSQEHSDKFFFSFDIIHEIWGCTIMFFIRHLIKWMEEADSAEQEFQEAVR